MLKIGPASEPSSMRNFGASHDEWRPDVRFCGIEAMAEERVRAEKRRLPADNLLIAQQSADAHSGWPVMVCGRCSASLHEGCFAHDLLMAGQIRATVCKHRGLSLLRPRPEQESAVLARSSPSRLRRWPSARLDSACARRSKGTQVGTKGWSWPNKGMVEYQLTRMTIHPR